MELNGTYFDKVPLTLGSMAKNYMYSLLSDAEKSKLKININEYKKLELFCFGGLTTYNECFIDK
jgi:hypothetical protein